MRFLLELDRDDKIAHFEREVGVQVALRVLMAALGEDKARLLADTLDDDSLIIDLGETYLASWVAANSVLQIPLDGISDEFTLTTDAPDEPEAPKEEEEDTTFGVYHIRSSTGAQYYQVEVTKGGKALSCTCPAYLYHPDTKCKHMTKAESYWKEDHEPNI